MASPSRSRRPRVDPASALGALADPPVADPAGAVPAALVDAVLAAYDPADRSLAFRATSDPYAILVAELMAQQTQAVRAAEAWSSWIARFPTVEALAAAPLAEVLRAWAGLGYNRRALALHRAALTIVERHGGRVPPSVEALEALPGVGPYTARAVAAIAFEIPVGAVDVNVRRVLGRIATGSADALPPRALQQLADAVVPPLAPGRWTHALMDIGSRHCRPARPRCGGCPAAPWCRAARADAVAGRPGAAPGGGRTAADEASRGAGARTRPAARPRVATPFPATRRWLRGRLVARARDAVGEGWVSCPAPVGLHDATAVREALAALAAEGLLEVREGADAPEARIPR